MTDGKAKVCWITGSYNHGREIIDKIKLSLGNACVECYGEENSAENIEMQILGSGLFSSNRLIILRDLPQYSGSKSNERWKDLLSNTPEDCTIVIDRVPAGSRRVLHKHVKDIGKVFDTPLHIKGVDAFSYVEAEFNKRGKNLSKDAISLFLQRIGEQSDGVSVDTMYMAIEQICAYVGKRKKNISLEEISIGLPINYSAVIWSIFAELDKKDFFECQKLFYHLCKSTSIADAVNQVCNMMLWRYRLLLLIKEQKSNNVPDDDKIVQDILKLHKLSKEGVGGQSVYSVEEGSNYSESVINNAVKGFYSKQSPVEFYSRTEIFKLMRVIHECNLKLRDVDSDIENLMIVDNIFMFVCGIIDEETLRKMRVLKND